MEKITTLEKGLAEAISEEPQYFRPLFVKMIAEGWKSGTLDTYLGKIVTYLEKEKEFERF